MLTLVIPWEVGIALGLIVALQVLGLAVDAVYFYVKKRHDVETLRGVRLELEHCRLELSRAPRPRRTFTEPAGSAEYEPPSFKLGTCLYCRKPATCDREDILVCDEHVDEPLRLKARRCTVCGRPEGFGLHSAAHEFTPESE